MRNPKSCTSLEGRGIVLALGLTDNFIGSVEAQQVPKRCLEMVELKD